MVKSSGSPSLPSSIDPAWMEVDLAALASNFREVRRRVGPDVQIIAAIKANAYGHGVVESASVLQAEGAYAVATGSFKNARAIREAGVNVRIRLPPGMLPGAAEEVLRYDLVPSVSNLETAAAVSSAASRPTPVFIKVDAGLARLGVALEEAEHLAMQVGGLPNLCIEGIFTHLHSMTQQDGIGRSRDQDRSTLWRSG